MIKFRPKLGDINEILAESIIISSEGELMSYLEERSFDGEELRFAELDESLLIRARKNNPNHWETHIVLLDGRVVGYSNGVAEKEFVVFDTIAV